ncbi:hypothetical protein SYNPS1DRAFT_23730 [Syncephalis pseudoplumigaleata]|uniref:DEAD-box helicase OB fold domain-containing protein n=1 Tax=Syncephalis pseudoplumigaleata TaxID=1712513 RepID=A0A4V1J185_9FUNG|nr:hypothetical protein SYNPS1DRAFT_23730 [Syncephalis pseudoplumigaleata]|eukprot:RKP24179.1 hypothetical protein SYNPS1DRAFT_23730 [Syncephalis pseudoplumigaleata]
MLAAYGRGYASDSSRTVAYTKDKYPGIERSTALNQTLKQNQDVYIHPSSALFEVNPKWVIYYELVLTSKEYIRQVMDIKAEWLVEAAPHYYNKKDIEDESRRKMPKTVTKS